MATSRKPFSITQSTQKLALRSPQQIWNSYSPPHELTHQQPIPALPTKRTHCMVRLYNFHPGDPARARRGKFADMITWEGPCLQPTCSNCRTRWWWAVHEPRPWDEASELRNALTFLPEFSRPLQRRGSSGNKGSLKGVMKRLSSTKGLHSERGCAGVGAEIKSSRIIGSRVRFRHKVKLAVRSKTGRYRFRKIVDDRDLSEAPSLKISITAMGPVRANVVKH